MLWISRRDIAAEIKNKAELVLPQNTEKSVVRKQVKGMIYLH